MIAQSYRDAIERGDLTPGACMPSIAELARRHLVSPNTAQRVLGRLKREGLITTHAGKPATVATTEES